MKPIRTLATRAVNELHLPNDYLKALFDIAIEHYPKDNITIFTQNTTVINSNGKPVYVDDIDLKVTIWIIGDDYGDFLAFTAMFPEER